MHIGAFVVCVFGGSGKRHFLLSDGRAFVFSAPGARFQAFQVGFFVTWISSEVATLNLGLESRPVLRADPCLRLRFGSALSYR